MIMILVTRDLIDIEALNKAALDPACGAVLSFSGTVRNQHNGQPVKELAYEAYESMAQAELQRVVDECFKQWPSLKKVQVVHRFGKMKITDSSVYITVSSPHRKDGFPALRYVIDTIKKDVPIWKKEFYENGESDWLHPEDGRSVEHLTLK
jgi:molybdopterin synthase catalytic subunit